jgi:hypothetical protein
MRKYLLTTAMACTLCLVSFSQIVKTGRIAQLPFDITKQIIGTIFLFNSAFLLFVVVVLAVYMLPLKKSKENLPNAPLEH